MKRFIGFFFLIFLATFLGAFVFLVCITPLRVAIQLPFSTKTWDMQSIDTMKTSRDLAREKLHDASFDAEIDAQVAAIAHTGANYIAIATPYDEEFVPILRRWVDASRKYHLKVWFRGNFSGWEGWFEYPRIDRQTHLVNTKNFILSHKDLFRDGDIFSSCPECENGIKIHVSDPAQVQTHREFLIAEYNIAKDAFAEIGKNVQANYFSMNGDLAKALMDKPTTQALGGIVVVDHYVSTPEKLAEDIKALALQSGGTIILGEVGAPIPDIHGSMTEEQQKEWIEKAFAALAAIPEVKGVNYWTNIGGSTMLWHEDGTPRAAVSAVKHYYSPNVLEE